MWFAHFFALFPQLVDVIYILISIICSTRWCDLHACLFSGLMWFTCLFVVLVLLVDVICMIICNICSTCWCDLHDCLYDFHYLLMWFTWLLVLLFDVIYMLICNICSTLMWFTWLFIWFSLLADVVRFTWLFVLCKHNHQQIMLPATKTLFCFSKQFLYKVMISQSNNIKIEKWWHQLCIEIAFKKTIKRQQIASTYANIRTISHEIYMIRTSNEYESTQKIQW